jgi:tRNA threonylcarbamoyladenosine biosynthesis protein TsaE
MINSKDYQIKNLIELNEFCTHLVKEFSEKTILLLDGPMGVGKTKTIDTIVRSLAVENASGGHAASPTFGLHNQYQFKELSIDHFDLYRIESEDDLESTGFWDVFLKPKGWIFIEWPDRLDVRNLPAGWKILKLSMKFESELRVFTLSEITQL